MALTERFGCEGQTVLIILLIIAVILTIGLSTISSSVTDIKVSQQTEESSRAYYVAESGLEEAFIAADSEFVDGIKSGNIGNIDYTVKKTAQGDDAEFLFPYQVSAGDPQTVWLVGHNTDGTLKTSEFYDGTKGNVKICWGENATEKSALMVSLVYESGGSYKIARDNYDSDPGRGNNFKVAGPGMTVKNKNLQYCSGEIQVPSGTGTTPYFVRLNLLYNSSPTSLGVVSVKKGTEDQPSLLTQGYCYTSAATVKESGITRKIEQCKLWPNLPNIFSWGLFSKEGDLQ
jgi:hypothetical protein